jgi:hypothetical protein
MFGTGVPSQSTVPTVPKEFTANKKESLRTLIVGLSL